MRVPITLELRALDSTDAVRVREWRNDHRIYRWCRQVGPISDVDQLAWYDRQSKDTKVRFYGVWLRVDSGSELIGVAGLTDICMLNRRAEFSLYVQPAKQRQGLGKQALTILLNHAFQNLGIEQVWGEVLHGNVAMKVFKDLGFQLDGKRRRWYFKEGQSWDSYLISILRSEWNDLNRRADSDLSTGGPSAPTPSPIQADAPPPGDEDRRGNEGGEEPAGDLAAASGTWDGRGAAQAAS